MPVPRASRSRSRVNATAAAAVAVAVIAGTAALADSARTRRDADQMLRKIALITSHGLTAQAATSSAAAPPPPTRSTTVTERELNSFLAFHGRDGLPAGVLDPAVQIAPAGRLTGRAIVDLDQVRKAQKAEGYSAMSLLTGRLPVQATGVLRTSNGVGKFELQEAWVSNIPIPKTLLREIVSHYSRGPDAPEGIDLEAPFELPVGIREIRTGEGQAIVVQ